MIFSDADEEIECEIIKSYGIFSRGTKFWNKEINFISWNGREPKLDIRNWQQDHKKCGKGITLTREEAEELVKLLSKVLNEEPGKGQPRGSRDARSSGKAKPSSNYDTKKKADNSAKAGTAQKRTYAAMRVPPSLEPFYKELKIFFGAGPDECKRARNTLLMKYHPDMYGGSVEFATRKTIKIKEAYEKIMGWWSGKR